MVNRTDKRQRGLAAADYVRLAEFRHLLRQFLVFSERAAGRAGLTAQQHQALLAIKGYQAKAAATVGHLAARLAIRHHSAVGLVDRLVAKALVRRRSGVVDRRQIRLELTPKAESRLARLSVAHRNELERLAPLLRVLLDAFGEPKTRKSSRKLPLSGRKRN
jgi:DNA-binding MarR family transcriptional regulator